MSEALLSTREYNCQETQVEEQVPSAAEVPQLNTPQVPNTSQNPPSQYFPVNSSTIHTENMAPNSASSGVATVPASKGVSSEHVRELFVIYDADGTKAGEIIYITKKLLGLGHCAACDITHGPRREKPEFTQLKAAGWSIPLRNIHRDEMDVALCKAVNGQLPCVAARTNLRDVVLLGQESLSRCNGDVLRFQKMVNGALREHSLYVPKKQPLAACVARSASAERNSNAQKHWEMDAVVPSSSI